MSIAISSQKRGESAWAPSLEVRVLLGPRSVYCDPAVGSAGRDGWRLFERPLLLALVLACTVSLITEGRLTLRLVLSAALTWSFVPLLQTVSLRAVWRKQTAPCSFARAIDLFFAGQGPWLGWLIFVGAFWSSVSETGSFAPPLWFSVGTAAAVAVWSFCIDFWFFRGVLQRSAAEAVRDLLVQRALAWSAGILFFGGSSLLPNLMRRLGL